MKDPEDCEHCEKNIGWGRDDVDEGNCKHHTPEKAQRQKRIKKNFLRVLRTEAISCRRAANEVEVGYHTIWEWRQDDPEFDEKVQHVKDNIQKQIRIEAVEDNLLGRILNDNASPAEVIFWLKNHGWEDSQTIEGDFSHNMNYTADEEDEEELKDYGEILRGRQSQN